jgi:hypothetical protein
MHIKRYNMAKISIIGGGGVLLKDIEPQSGTIEKTIYPRAMLFAANVNGAAQGE